MSDVQSFSDKDHVLLRKQAEVCSIVINRPTVLNAIGWDMIEDFRKAFQIIKADKETRVIIVEGAGGNFSAGADVELLRIGMSAPEYLNLMKSIGEMVKMVRAVPQPVICKVQGVAVGGGMNLALAGDFVVATHGARFQEIFIHIAVGLDAGGTYILPRLVGLAKARELAMLGEPIDGRTAASIGMIYKSVDDEELDQMVDTLARRLAARSPWALASMKEGLDASFDMSLAQALEHESTHQSILFQTTEHREAVRRFLESRGKRS